MLEQKKHDGIYPDHAQPRDEGRIARKTYTISAKGEDPAGMNRQRKQSDDVTIRSVW